MQVKFEQNRIMQTTRNFELFDKKQKQKNKKKGKKRKEKGKEKTSFL